MSLQLKSGFVFDYDNLFGEGRVTAADMEELAPKLQAAHSAMKKMRETGFVKAHLSKDGEPEKVLFSQLPYIAADHLNSPQSISRLHELTDSVRDRVDTVISLGIGGSYLGNKVLFDVHCGEFWNSRSKAQRGGLPEVYFSGNNIDPRRTGDLIEHLESQAQITRTHAGRKYRVMLLESGLGLRAVDP